MSLLMRLVFMWVLTTAGAGRSPVATVRFDGTPSTRRKPSRFLAELLAANRQVEAAKAEAEAARRGTDEAERIRSEFVLMINHEFRTPLTTVVTGAELLKEGHILDDEMRYAILDDMTRDGKRLEELIDQMLTVARVENFGLGLTLREYRFSSLWDDLQAGHHSLKLAAKPSFGEEMVIQYRSGGGQDDHCLAG